MNVDEDGFIKNQQLSAGNTHDSQVFEVLLTGTEKDVYADSAYKSEKHDKLLASKGIKNKLLERSYRNKAARMKSRLNARVKAMVAK